MRIFKPIRQGLTLVLSGLLLSVGIWFTGTEEVINNLSQFPLWIFFTMLVVFALNLLLVSFRLKLLLSYFDIKVTFYIAANASVKGHFASLFFISLFGQVAGRQSVLRHYGTQPVFIAALTAIERIILFVVSAGLSIIGAVWIFDGLQILEFLDSTSLTQILFVAGLALVVSLWTGRTSFEKLLFKGVQSRSSYGQLAEATLITLLAQSLILGAFVLAGYALTPQIGFFNLLAAAAITSFAASLPISVNGWGVREIAAVSAFGAVGMPAPLALAISIMVGLSSTAVVLATFPYVYTKPKSSQRKILITSESQFTGSFSVEKMAAWGLSMAVAIFIFFQLHIQFQGGSINLNLADPFAILALATVITHSFFTGVRPRWSVPYFNLMLIVILFLLLFSFLNGMQVIGVTQWAFVSRLLGWIVLLGYLSIGILTVSYLGKLGVWRLVETLVVTSVVIILFHAIVRWLIFSGWLDQGSTTFNFEGFSGNRNAFAFQLLTCSLLLLAHTARRKGEGSIEVVRLIIRRKNLYAILNGIILAGIVLTGSRAGILTGFLLLFFSGISNFVDRRMLLSSLIYGCLVWMFFTLFLPWLSLLSVEQISTSSTSIAPQSSFSQNNSDIERWATLRHGFEMWLSSPWIGAGLGVFIEMSSQWLKEPTVIHSTPIWILAEFGLLGATILIAIFSWTLVTSIQNGLHKPANRAVVLLLGVFVIFSQVHEIFYQRIFWLVLGLCLAISYKNYSHEKLSKSSAHS